MLKKLRIFISVIVEKIWFLHDILEMKFKKLTRKVQVLPISEDFITGDYFKKIVNFVVDDDSIDYLFSEPKSKLKITKSIKKNIFFFELSKLSPEKFNTIATKIEKKSKLIFHNGDNFNGFDIDSLRKKNVNIFAVNSIDSPNITALPIGIENSQLNKNGKIEEFYPVNRLKTNLHTNRKIVICVNFRLRTNYDERYQALIDVSTIPHASFFWFKSPKKIHQIYRNSLFVISPPGNGVDCHRTWESLYCGAIPILLEGKLDRKLAKDLPILFVKNYRDINRIESDELIEIYKSMWKLADLDKLNPVYWKKLIYES